MEYAVPYLTNGSPTPFTRPQGIVDTVVCRLSGTLPSNQCDSQYSEIFAFDQPPLPATSDLVRRINIDLWSGYEASDVCKGPSEETKVLNVTDKWARDWFDTGDGRNWLDNHGLPVHPYFAPERACREGDPQPQIELKLNDAEVITTANLDIKGTAAAEQGFKSWRLEFAQGADPGSWTTLTEGNNQVKDGTFFNWNLSSLPNGPITLRLVLIGEKAEVDKRVTFNLNLPLPPTATPTLTITPLPPTETPTLFIPSNTPIPSDTPPPTATP
jgi:hypothetical protein